MLTEKTAKYHCLLCDYLSSNKTDYERHLLTNKHKKRENVNNLFTKNLAIIGTHNCGCGKQYKSRQGLYSHKKKCAFLKEAEDIRDRDIDIDKDIDKELGEKTYIDIDKELVEKELGDKRETNISVDFILETIKKKDKMIETLSQNLAEATKTITELAPHIGNYNNNTINNNQFNINVFLNQKCKDAINMTDFIKSIEVSLEQLNFTRTNGLEKGVCNLIVENMNKLSLYERPIHCTDMKRETLYIKDHNNWEKDYNKIKVKEIIKKTSSKNYQALQQWIKENPDYMNNEFKQTYFANAISTLGKPTNEIDEKIIKKICNKFTLKDN